MTTSGPAIEGRESGIGVYRGFSTPSFDGSERTSCYVAARDGTRLAVDVYRPTRGGIVEELPLPVAWTAKRYLRATMQDGRLTSSLLQGGPVEQEAPGLLLAHGYVLASVDMRGTGASFGKWTECSDPSVADDGYDITEWLAAQEWCDGNVGMFGASYEGRMQFSVASSAPPHLKAIMPEVSPFDWYSLVTEGGGYSKRFVDTGAHFKACDLNPAVAPVDDDPDGALAAAARADHERLNDYRATSGELPFRDSPNDAGVPQWQERSGEALLAGIERSGVASYHTSGWFAPVGREQLLWYSNMQRSATAGRHRLLMGPWPGGGVAGAAEEHRHVWALETLRFMDHWLKGVDNGIMDGSPIVHSTVDADGLRTVREWRTLEQWPPPVTHQELTLTGPRSGSSRSVNDGSLEAGPGDDATDDLTIDFDLVAPFGDWHFNGKYGADLSPYDSKCLTYTTAALTSDATVTGHPVVHLFVSLDGERESLDADVIVHLEDVHEDGSSNFVSQRRIRVSHRAIAEAPCYNFDVPWHPYSRMTQRFVAPGEVVELVLDLRPISYRWLAGHRLRLTVAGADGGEVAAPDNAATTLHVHRGGEHHPTVALPFEGEPPVFAR